MQVQPLPKIPQPFPQRLKRKNEGLTSSYPRSKKFSIQLPLVKSIVINARINQINESGSYKKKELIVWNNARTL